MTDHSDIAVRFLFEHCAVRGVWVRLTQSCEDMFALQDHARTANVLLGESAAAAVMLSRGIKLPGRLAIQARGSGSLRLLVAESTQYARVRGTIDMDDVTAHHLRELIADGYLAVVFMPETGESHQGLVPLQGDRLQDCLADYFRQSEQLLTALWLACDGKNAAGLMLQALPGQEHGDEDWRRLHMLASTVTDDELLSLSYETLLHRLFHEEEVQVFAAEPVGFQCTCSEERSRNALTVLGRDELQKLFAEQPLVSLDCQFCGHQYRYTADDMQALLGTAPERIH